MLTRSQGKVRSSRNPRRERRFWHDSSNNMPSLGCGACPDRLLCGTLNVKRSMFTCLDYCCGKPDTCDVVCRNNPEVFVKRIREVGGLALDNVPRAAVLNAPTLPEVIPLIYHGNRRETAFAPEVAALSLYQMFSRRDGSPKFTSRSVLCREYRLSSRTGIILTGTDEDPPLERFWGLGRQRRELIRVFRSLGVILVTTPNYSLFIDQPRWDDLHAMKRIGLVHAEFLDEGLPCALHVNGRTETDFRHWAEYVIARPEVNYLAFEFTTGTGWAGRREQHVQWLVELARAAIRPLNLIVRGGVDVYPQLAAAFARVSIIDTTVFMRTIKRRRAVASDGNPPTWIFSPTATGVPLDRLLAENFRVIEAWLRTKVAVAGEKAA